MTRPAPAPLPTTLPDHDTAFRHILKVINTPRVRLYDLCIDALVENYCDGSPCWLTGSNVWMPAVFGMDPDPNADFDIVFETQNACDRFTDGVLKSLSGFSFTKGESGFGATRILHPDGKGVIDAWAIPGHSIAELLVGYQDNYQRAAFSMSRSPTAGSLTRLVRPIEWPQRTRGRGGY